MNQLIIVSGPSGVGKNTLVDVVRERYNYVEYFKKDTTRIKRPDDRDAEANFMSVEEFKEKQNQHKIILPYEVRGQQYGLPIESFAKLKEHPRIICLSNFDLIKSLSDAFDTVNIYVTANKDQIIERLNRRADTPEQRQRSIDSIEKHLKEYEQNKSLFYYEIINGDSLDESKFRMRQIADDEFQVNTTNYNFSLLNKDKMTFYLSGMGFANILESNQIARWAYGRKFESEKGTNTFYIGDGVEIRHHQYYAQEVGMYSANIIISGSKLKVLKASRAIEDVLPILTQFKNSV